MYKPTFHNLLSHAFGKKTAAALEARIGPEVTAILASRHDLLTFLAGAYVQAEAAAKQLILDAATSAGIVFAATGKLPTLAQFLAPLADIEKLLLADIHQAVLLLVAPPAKPVPPAPGGTA